ncbi:AAA family ATPase [Burkholderia cenocepacia]|uniref:AAA family ATPase n=1 Tax=Burkholderia cenocepacia TaxID=95486 RepID=UPI0009E11D37|nr:AAA family ATPase [Burkholderia cenocepacia]ARF84453.1 helicase [Burkholderia cenocepacia]MDC6082110.1 AAA family ATPase [Burkholderia cenocepacia]
MMNGHDAVRARDALFALSADLPRDEWWRYLASAKAAGVDKEVAREWSAQSERYNASDFEATWRSFKPEGGIGPGTLFKMAMDAGWRDPRARNVLPAARAPVAKSPKADAAPKPRTDLAATFEGYPPAVADHRYIVAKRGNPDGLRMVPADDGLTIGGQRVAGWLALPARSLDGTLRTIQYIPPPGTGKKLNAPGASFSDGLFVVGNVGPDSTLYVCEGIGQAWACAKADYHAAAVVTFGAGRTRPVAKLLRKQFPAARIVIVPDRGKEADAEDIAREITGAWVEMPTDKPANYDANDFEADHGIDGLADLLRAAKAPPLRYRLQSADELLSAPPLRWMVQGVLPASGFAAVYGPSGSGKSFLVLDLCAAIAAGADWFGRRATAAPVTYVCLEGEAGLGKRAKAWSIRKQGSLPSRLRFVTQPLDLRQSEDVADLCAAVLTAGGRDGLLVIDTLNRAAPGTDENSSVDMGQLIEACKVAQRRLGGVVLLVHHTGKDGAKGLRGHSSLYAALDAAIEVSRHDARREWSVAKSKDDADGGRNAFTLRVIELGDDDRGEPITSCVVEQDDTAPVPVRPIPKGKTQRLVYEALGELLRAAKDCGKGGAPAGRPCIQVEAAVPVIGERLACRPDQRQYQVRRAINAMSGEREIYQLREGWIWAN